MKVILLIMIGLSMLHAELTRANDVVTDSITKLEWQDNAVGTQMSWQNAIENCENLTLSGNSDWRLPNINELRSIVDRTNYNPAIAHIFQNNNEYLNYWASSTFAYESDKKEAWTIDFTIGSSHYFSKDDSENLSIRCVRGGL